MGSTVGYVLQLKMKIVKLSGSDLAVVVALQNGCTRAVYNDGLMRNSEETAQLLLHVPSVTLSHVVYIMDLTDRMLYKICPFVAAGVVVGSVYWTAVTYGAVTVMQVLGHKEGLTVMEEADPLFLLVGLPTIPIMLILGKMVRWEDFVLKFWRRHCGWIKLFSGSVSASSSYYEQPRTNGFSFSDPISATRVLCGALMLPTIATVFGRVFFNNIPSSLQRALLGGIMFVAIKGAFKIYLKQQQYIRKCKRRILDFSQDIEDISNQYQPDL
ncbi:E3 ubiquitin-protein ligase MARCHF5-like isoform X4 [Tachypleus tridentatus]|uniref:E3 ubiquitin-protein ligase MARCHF5-like isoform X4 n=1 Tax=Tachypleus tridentatus TaxID=6853 RepID=UPI003FD63249